jgi:proteasome accessory factor B
VIPKEKYYLPEIEFEPGELVALLVASQSGGQDPAAESGARKLLYGADGGVLAGLGGGPLASGSDARSNLVHAVAEAAQELRRVRFSYRTSQGRTGERDVDAWAMVFRAGHWYLVGHDRERGDVRAFRLSRMEGEIADAGPGSAPPADFRAADHVEAGPWVAAGDDRAVVLFSPERAWFAEAQFPGARVVGIEDDGWVALEVPMADEGAFAAMLLEYGPDARVRSPTSLRDAMISRLEALLA